MTNYLQRDVTCPLHRPKHPLECLCAKATLDKHPHVTDLVRLRGHGDEIRLTVPRGGVSKE